MLMQLCHNQEASPHLVICSNGAHPAKPVPLPSNIRFVGIHGDAHQNISKQQFKNKFQMLSVNIHVSLLNWVQRSAHS